MNNRLNIVFIYDSYSYKIPGETANVQQGIKVDAKVSTTGGNRSKYNR